MPVASASRSYSAAMTTKTVTTHPEGVAPAPTLRAESEAIYAAAATAASGTGY